MFKNYSGKIWIVIVALIVIAATMFYGVASSKQDKQSLSSSVKNDTPKNVALLDTAKVVIDEKDDPCGGTGGTGEIVSVGNKIITIKRNDGVKQMIKIGKQTKIKNSAGPLSESDLKPGYRVTVVVGLITEDSKIASAILVCNGKS